jgi:hypothetical protein
VLTTQDILIPAFRQRGTFENTASSTMGTAMIVRTPVLASDRHIKGYTYIRGPACVSRDVGEPEVSALARLRRESIEARRSGAGSTRPPGARQENEWRLLLDSIHFDNSLIWPRFLK